MGEDINIESVPTRPRCDWAVIRNHQHDGQMQHRYEAGDSLTGLSLVRLGDGQLSDSFGGVDTNLVAVTEHGRENVLQEGQDVLVGLEQTPHGLQLHHLGKRAVCNWEFQQQQKTHAC